MASGRLELEGEHSAAFLDAQWLACKIREFFTNDSTIKGPFCLIGIRAQVRFPYMLRRLAITFSPQHSVGDWPPILPVTKIPDRQAQPTGGTPEGMPECHFNRVLAVGEKQTPKEYLLEHPKRWQVAARKALSESGFLPRGPLPFFARHQRVYFDQDELQDELALQLILVLGRWGLATDLTSADSDALIGYVCRVCGKRGHEFRGAAQETVGYLITNWVMPQRTCDFRAYVRRVAYGQYFGARRRTLTAEEGELENLRATKGKKRARSQLAGGNEGVSVRELASQEGLHHQRLNEAIREGKLPATWKHGKYWVEPSDAKQYLKDIAVKRAARALRKVLMQAGKEREAEAIRKRIYRAKKSGATDKDLLQIIKASISIT